MNPVGVEGTVCKGVEGAYEGPVEGPQGEGVDGAVLLVVPEKTELLRSCPGNEVGLNGYIDSWNKMEK